MSNEFVPLSETVGRARSPVLKAFRLVQHVAAGPGPVTLADLSRAVALPKPTTYRLASLLARADVLVRDPITRGYGVGAAFERMAVAAIRNARGHDRRQLLLQSLAEKVGERINLGVLSEGQVQYVEWVESTSPLRVALEPGTRVPAHCSANGKLLLAHAPAAVQRRFLAAAPFARHTRTTLTSARALAAQLAEIRQRGWAEDDEEYLLGVCCLAVPVRDRQGEVVAGLAIMAPSARLPLPQARRFVADLNACAAALAPELARADERAPAGRPRPAPASRAARATASRRT